MMNEALVSIIIPVYNRQTYIRKCLLSCIEQDYRPIEIVIINDGSTDCTCQIVQDFIIEFENRDGVLFRYLNQEKLGAPTARNLGLEAASGDFIQFLDSDDMFTRNGISVKVNAFRNCDVVFGDCIKMNAESQPVRNYCYNDYTAEDIISYVAGKSIITGCLLFKRACFDTVKFDTSVQVLQERELCMRLLVLNFRFKYVPEFVYYHRLPGNDNISSVHWIEQNSFRYIHTHKLILRHIHTLNTEIVKKTSRRIARDLWRRGRYLMMSEKQEAARVYFNLAITINGGKIPKGKFFRIGARIISHYKVEQLYCFFKYPKGHKYKVIKTPAGV